MKKCVVVYNAHSGREKKRSFLFVFEDILAAHGYSADIRLSEYPGHIREIVQALPENVQLVISLGGDGTFSEAVAGNLQRPGRLVLAHIPMGTTNDIGAMFGYGKDALSNLKLLLDGVEKRIDICTVNGVPFVYAAGFGRFVRVSYETSREMKKRYGYWAYLLSGVRDFFGPGSLYDLKYEVDGEAYSGSYQLLLAGNATRIAGFDHMFPDTRLDDDRFEVLACDIKNRKELLKAMASLRKKDMTKVPGIYLHRASSLKIHFNCPEHTDWSLDGERLACKDHTVEIKAARQITVRLPKQNVDKLFAH